MECIEQERGQGPIFQRVRASSSPSACPTDPWRPCVPPAVTLQAAARQLRPVASWGRKPPPPASDGGPRAGFSMKYFTLVTRIFFLKLLQKLGLGSRTFTPAFSCFPSREHKHEKQLTVRPGLWRGAFRPLQPKRCRVRPLRTQKPVGSWPPASSPQPPAPVPLGPSRFLSSPWDTRLSEWPCVSK